MPLLRADKQAGSSRVGGGSGGGGRQGACRSSASCMPIPASKHLISNVTRAPAATGEGMAASCRLARPPQMQPALASHLLASVFAFFGLGSTMAANTSATRMGRGFSRRTGLTAAATERGAARGIIHKAPEAGCQSVHACHMASARNPTIPPSAHPTPLALARCTQRQSCRNAWAPHNNPCSSPTAGRLPAASPGHPDQPDRPSWNKVPIAPV